MQYFTRWVDKIRPIQRSWWVRHKITMECIVSLKIWQVTESGGLEGFSPKHNPSLHCAIQVWSWFFPSIQVKEWTDLAFTCPDVSQVQKYNISTCSTLSKSRLETALLWSQEEGQVPMESKLLWPSTLGSLKGRWFHNVIMLNIVFVIIDFKSASTNDPCYQKLKLGKLLPGGSVKRAGTIADCKAQAS